MVLPAQWRLVKPVSALPLPSDIISKSISSVETGRRAGRGAGGYSCLAMLDRCHLMLPFACVPLASRGVVRSVLSGLAHVRAHERSMDCFVGRLRAWASNGRQASFSQSPLALAASVLVLVSCVAYPLYGIGWLGRLVPPGPLS